MDQNQTKVNKLAGWVCSICFMFSGLPAVISAFQTGISEIHNGTLALWTLGEICAILYILPRRDIPLLANYSVNIVFIVILWWFKIKGV